MKSKKWYRRRKRLFEILEVGNDLDHVSRVYDFFNAFTIVLNLIVSIMYTYENMRMQHGAILLFTILFMLLRRLSTVNVSNWFLRLY